MLKNLTLLIVSTVLCVALLEVALRVIFPERLAYVPALLNNDTTYVPNQHQRSRHLEWDYEIQINADGFRNDLSLAEIPRGTILALGDSFTEGYGVALENSFPKLLQQRLTASGTATHVYNAGHYDTGLPTYRRVYRKIFREYASIDRVVIGLFVGNDVLDRARAPDGRLRLGNEFGDGWRYRLKVFLGSNVAIYAALNYTIKTNATLFRACQALGACYQPRPPNIYSSDAIDNLVRHTSTYVAEFVEEIRRDDRQVLITLIPTREQVDDEFWARVVGEYGPDADKNRYSLNHELAQTLKTIGIDVIDLTDRAVQRQRIGKKRLYFRYDGHWNPQGHEFAARQLLPHFLQ